MPGSRGTERRAMPGAVYVRLPDELAARLAATADQAGLTAAAWLRQLAVGVLDVAASEIRPTPPRRALPPDDVVAVVHLREVVGEAVGALVCSAAFTREGGLEQAHAELEAIIPVFRQHALGLDRLKRTLLGGSNRGRAR